MYERRGTQREEVMAGYIPWMVGWVMLLMMLEMEEEEEEEERRRMELDREGRRKERGMQTREAEKMRGKEAKSGIKKGKKTRKSF